MHARWRCATWRVPLPMPRNGRDMRHRRNAERRGRRSENWAAFALMLKGYRILARRLRTPLGEIDLVARSPSGILCFVEVKARRAYADAAEALRARQQARIARAAVQFLGRNPSLGRSGVRFDIVLVTAGHWPQHLRDAWRPDRG